MVGFGSDPVSWPASVSFGSFSVVATSWREKPRAEKS